jgi:hypothetical protein
MSSASPSRILKPSRADIEPAKSGSVMLAEADARPEIVSGQAKAIRSKKT